MSTAEHLDTVGTIARALVAADALPDRLGRAMAALYTSVPFVRARVVVLGNTPWSYVVPTGATPQPGQNEPSAAPDWPRHWTNLVIRSRQPHAWTLHDRWHYLGWPILWTTELYGVLEVCVDVHGTPEALPQLIAAIAPLFAAALGGESDSTTLHHIADRPDDAAAIEDLRCQLEAPLQLKPSIRCVLDWVVHTIPADYAELHLLHRDGEEMPLLRFSWPDVMLDDESIELYAHTLPADAPGTGLVHTTLAAQQPMWRRNGHGLELGLPLVGDGRLLGALFVAGHELQQHHLEMVRRTGPIIGAALHRAEVYHQEMEARIHLQQVFDSLPTGLALVDSDGRLLRANQAWPRHWGLPPIDTQTPQDVPWDMFEPLLTRLPDPLAFDAFFRQRDTEVHETTFTLQYPHQELLVWLIPVHDSLGLRPSYLLVVNDVTRERELDRLKSEFVSVVSHELRTPLTSVLGYTELLQAREFPAHERRDLIDTIWKQATHLSNLVEDLLNVSRIDAGRLNMTRWPLPLSQVVNELTAQLNKALDQTRHRLLLDVSDRLPLVYADRDKLRQILQNLLSNAIKYSPEGGEIVLQASVLETPPPGAPPLPPEPALLITVRDPGIGIPPNEIERIFERFYRVDNSNTRKIGGTGLGLAITQALVELHGGRIWVESVAGEGSTFFFTLPLAKETPHQTAKFLHA